MKSPGLGQPLQCSLAFQGLEMRGAGVARRPKIGTEISISASSSIGTESSKSASNSTIRSPDPQAVLTQAIRKTFPDLCPRFEKMSMESRKDGKAAKTALHVCARVIVPAIKKTPSRVRTRGLQVVASACRLFRGGRRGVGGGGTPSGPTL
jgi:hypothetical protein